MPESGTVNCGLIVRMSRFLFRVEYCTLIVWVIFRFLFWTEESLGAIRRCDLKGDSLTSIVSTNLVRPSVLAIHHGDKELFCVLGAKSKHYIINTQLHMTSGNVSPLQINIFACLLAVLHNKSGSITSLVINTFTLGHEVSLYCHAEEICAE